MGGKLKSKNRIYKILFSFILGFCVELSLWLWSLAKEDWLNVLIWPKYRDLNVKNGKGTKNISQKIFYIIFLKYFTLQASWFHHSLPAKKGLNLVDSKSKLKATNTNILFCMIFYFLYKLDSLACKEAKMNILETLKM